MAGWRPRSPVARRPCAPPGSSWPRRWRLRIVRPLIEVASLCISEVATNAIRHARAAFRVTVEARASEVVVEVEDQGEGKPVLAAPDFDRDSGRGLWLVAATAARWGSDRMISGGKVVWFSVSTLSLPQP